MTEHMQIPPDFRYREILLRGRPVHGPQDRFSIRHPSMPMSRRAKILSPFDALKGFSEAVAAKTVPYVPRRELNEEQRSRLDQMVADLRARVPNSRAASRLRLQISIEYFVPCEDTQHEAFGRLGRYRILTGILQGIDVRRRTILLADQEISFRDISDIRIPETSATGGYTSVTRGYTPSR